MPDTLTTIKVNDIHVVDDHNPRKSFDETTLRRLGDSIAANGLTSPLLVRPRKKGGYELIAGERRLRACKLIKRADVPALVRDDDNARSLALIENVMREDLNPLEEARAYAELIAEQGINQKQLAAQTGISPAQISQRLSILQTPETAQRLLGERKVSLEHTKTLRNVAAVDENFSAALAKVLVGAPRLEREQLDAFDHSYQGYCVRFAGRVRPEDLVPLENADLANRYAAAFESVWQWPRWEEADVDAAAAFGCLVDVPYIDDRGESAHAYYATDPQFIIGRLEQHLERAAQAARDRAAADKQGAGETDATGAELTPEAAEKAAAARKAERAKQAKAKAQAREFNFELGERLRLQLKAPEFTLERARLLAYVILQGNENRHLGPASFAVMDPSTSEVNDRGSMKVMTLGEAKADLLARVDNAKSGEEVLGVLLQAFIGSQLIDPGCLPMSQRPSYAFPRSWEDARVAEALTLDEALKVLKKNTPTYKRVKRERSKLKEV